MVIASLALGCAGAVARAFDRWGYAYPLAIDLRVVEPNACTPGGSICDAGGMVDTLEHSLARIDIPALTQLMTGLCPDAEAISAAEPFLLSSHLSPTPEVMLGLRIRCYGRGELKGRDLSELSVAQINAGVETAPHLDNWLYARVDDDYWTLENVLVFDIRGNQTRFLSLFETWDDSDESDRLNRIQVYGVDTSFKHPIAVIGRCGTTSQVHRCE